MPPGSGDRAVGGWGPATMKPLNVRAALIPGLVVGAAGLAGYLTGNPHPTALGALEMAAASLLAVLAVVGLGVRTNRQLRGPGGPSRRG